MKKFSVALSLAAASLVACSNGQAIEVSAGSDVTLQKKDGVTVSGRLVEIKSDKVVVETRNGEKLPVARADIATLRADVHPAAGAEPAPAAQPGAVGSTGNAADGQSPKPPSNPVARAFGRTPEYREVTIPSGTVLSIDLRTALASDKSSVEDAVRGTLRQA